MRVLASAILLAAPLALLSIAVTPASADSAMQELRSTEGLNADPAPATAPATQGSAASESATPSTRRHRVAGSHDEREHLRQSQIHG